MAEQAGVEENIIDLHAAQEAAKGNYGPYLATEMGEPESYLQYRAFQGLTHGAQQQQQPAAAQTTGQSTSSTARAQTQSGKQNGLAVQSLLTGDGLLDSAGEMAFEN